MSNPRNSKTYLQSKGGFCVLLYVKFIQMPLLAFSDALLTKSCQPNSQFNQLFKNKLITSFSDRDVLKTPFLVQCRMQNLLQSCYPTIICWLIDSSNNEKYRLIIQITLLKSKATYTMCHVNKFEHSLRILISKNLKKRNYHFF